MDDNVLTSWRYFLLNDGTRYFPSDEQVANLQDAYKGVNVAQQLKAMKLWCEGNPTKRKTLKGAQRFMQRWMSDQQDKVGRFGDNSVATQMARDRGIGPDEFRHCQAAREVMRNKLAKVPPPLIEGTFKINLSKLADAIIADVYADTERWPDEWNRVSACYGTIEVAVRRQFIGQPT